MRLFGFFLTRFVRHWAGMVTGGVAVAGLAIWERYSGRKAPAPLFWLIVAAAFVASAFSTWKEEHDRANNAEAERDRTRAVAEIPREAPAEDIFWLLTVVQKLGLKRQRLDRNVYGAMVVECLWIGGTPVDHERSQSFYSLVTKAKAFGLLLPVRWDEPGEPLILSEEGGGVLNAGKREQRKPSQPGVLIDARTGQPFYPLGLSGGAMPGGEP